MADEPPEPTIRLTLADLATIGEMYETNEDLNIADAVKEALASVRKTTGEWLTVADAADALQVSRKTVYRWIEEGKLPVHKLGGGYRIRRAEFEDWIETQRVEPTAHDIDPWR